jgi:hypothetical protein
MPTARRNDAYFKRLPCLYQYFELIYAGVRARLETRISTQSAGALKLGIQVDSTVHSTVARPNVMSKTSEWP